MDREYYQTDETPDEPYQRPCCPRPGRGNRKRKPETGRCGYSQVTETIAGDFRQVVAERGKTLETHIPPGVHVRSEEKLFGQILGILLDNAVKYCDEKGRVQVEVTTEKKEKGFAIIISNDFAEGEDIDYTKFFERFYRHDISHSSQIKGYGVGLSMAADIVKLLDGTIDVSWKEGRISFRLDF